MTARLVLPPEAPEEEWLAARRQGVTASEIAVVLGISPFDSPFNLFYKKLGAIPDDFDSDRLELGRVLEPYVASRFARAHPELHLAAPSGLWASTERLWQLATPDGRIFETVPTTYGGLTTSDDAVAVWEGKTSGTYEGWGEDGSADVPAYIAAQVQWQMDVMGVRAAYVSCLFLATQQIRTYEIAYDEGDVDLMRKRALEFWDDVQAGNVPELDALEATTSALRALYPKPDDSETVTVPTDVAEHYRWAKAAVKAAKDDATLAENRLRDAMADAKYAIDADGQKVATRSVYDRKGYTVGPAHIDALKPASTKKEATL